MRCCSFVAEKLDMSFVKSLSFHALQSFFKVRIILQSCLTEGKKVLLTIVTRLVSCKMVQNWIFLHVEKMVMIGKIAKHSFSLTLDIFYRKIAGN